MNLEEIKNRWHEVLARVKKYNHSLSFILRVCQPRDIAGRELCLAFKYKFHKDRVNNIQVKGLVENILSEVYGQPLSIQAIIDETLEINSNSLVAPVAEIKEDSSKKEGEAERNMLDNLLKTFGGKIVK